MQKKSTSQILGTGMEEITIKVKTQGIAHSCFSSISLKIREQLQFC
jgi:hypothetical protein